MRPALSDYLRAMEPLFDADIGLPVTTWKGPGYHTRVPAGKPVHEVRVALDHALALFEENSPASVHRALAILDRVLPLQDLDPARATYGIWPWLLEEPLDQMSPPDWNWADFCGVRLVHLLGAFHDRLPSAHLQAVQRALHAAARSIFRRNVGPGYTNICFKGAVVCGAAGELLDDPFLCDYALSRLDYFLAHIRTSGGFTEYSSPPYTFIVLHEAERALLTLRSPALRDAVTAVHRLCWDDLVTALHLPTGQLCGPLSRTYADLLQPNVVHHLEQRLGLPLFRPPGEPSTGALPGSPSYPIPPLPCPDDLRRALLDRPAGSFIRRRYVFSATEPKRERTASRWFGPDACLGSANYENLWTQRRPLLGYWRTGDTIATLRASIRHDGDRDFCSGALRVHQEGRSVLALASLVTERGDFHDVLDRPADGIFRLADLHLSIQVRGPGATIVETFPGVFTLACGPWQAVVRPACGIFDGHTISWRAEQRPDDALLRAVVDDGAPLVLEPAAVAAFAIGFTLHLQPADLPVAFGGEMTRDTRTVTLHAASPDGPLALSAPLKPEPL
jgi:hypothetical protein